jgi:hypothetical protein
METSMTLEQYFHEINKEKQDMPIWKEDEEPLTQVYFQITTPAVEQYPAHTHTANIQWNEGARWYDVLWEVMGVLEASYGYSIKEKVFFNMHELNIQAEQEHGNPDLAAQMFSKDLS